jgi:hypothetical protein
MFELFKILIISAFTIYMFTSVVIAEEVSEELNEDPSREHKSKVNERLDKKGDRKEQRREKITGNGDQQNDTSSSDAD